MSPSPDSSTRRPTPLTKASSVHRRDHDLLGHELLDAMQHGLALGAVELGRLLAEEAVHVRVSTVRELPTRDRVGLEPGGGVPERAADDLDEVLELLLGDALGDALVEGGELERTQLGPNPHTLEIADHRLGRIGGRHVAEILAGIEASGVTGFGEQPLGTGGIEGIGGCQKKSNELGAMLNVIRESPEGPAWSMARPAIAG